MSVVVQVLEELVKKTSPECRVDVFSYLRDFDKLWDIDFQASEIFIQAQGKTIVIVWDGIPAGNTGFVDTTRYLTPIDWAVALSLALHGTAPSENNRKKYPNVKILIFDLDSHSISHSDSVKLVNQFPKRSIMSMPWVRLFRPLDAEVLIANVLGKASVDDNVPSMNISAQKEGFDLGVVRNIWASILTRPSEPGDHHALANLIGPLLLIKETKIDKTNSHVTSGSAAVSDFVQTENNTTDLHVRALSHLMKSIGLLPAEEKSEALLTSENPWIDWENPFWKDGLNHLIQEGTKLNCILIDDQIKNGWDEVLSMALGVDKYNNISLTAFDTAERIVKKIEDIVGTGQIDQRFNLSFGDKSNEPEILFLDLRLFSGLGVDKESDFFERLIPLAKKFEEDGTNNFPWKGFEKGKEGKKGEIDQVLEWIKLGNRKRESSDYITALTFLPRILALTDLSLPIIIFSSTGRRDITEILKPYGNIITAFDKPRFTVDIPLYIAEQTKGKFQKAIEKAIKILQGRQICKKVKQLGDTAQKSPHLVPDDTSIPPFKHIEIYIDETGTPKDRLFTVGGVVIAYPEYTDVSKLDKALKRNGIHWYSSDSANVTHLSKRPGRQNEGFQGACAKTDWNYKNAGDTLLSLSKNNGCFVTAVCINDILGAHINLNERHFPLKDLSSDARYVRVLSMLIELILFEMIPAWIKNKVNEVTVSIFAGTRISPVEMDKKQTLATSEKPFDYFGFGRAHTDYGNPQNYYTIGAESIVSFVSRVLDLRNDLHDHVSVHHSRGVTLTYGVPVLLRTGKMGNILKWDNIRVQNYFSDIVIGNKDLFKDQFTVGFNTDADEDLYTLVEAQHELQNDNLPLAIELMSSCSKVEEKMHGHIAKKLADSLNTISGFNYSRICQNSTLNTDGGGASTENELDKKRKIIVVSGVKEIYGGGIKLFCINEAGDQIIVSTGQTKKIGRNAYKLKKGDRLVATVDMENNNLYGRDISLA